jgi:hypothetical protein
MAAIGGSMISGKSLIRGFFLDKNNYFISIFKGILSFYVIRIYVPTIKIRYKLT